MKKIKIQDENKAVQNKIVKKLPELQIQIQSLFSHDVQVSVIVGNKQLLTTVSFQIKWCF